MSCRHDLAGGTCLRCYPATGSIDPGPEEDYEPNLEGPGAVTLKEYQQSQASLSGRPVSMILHGERVATDIGPKIGPALGEEGGGEVGDGGGLLRERQARGAALRKDVEPFRGRGRAARVKRAEEWLRDLAQFFKDGEVRDNMLVILDEVERLRTLIRQLGGEP